MPVDQEIMVGKFSGLSSHCITVSTVEDNILENTESFFLIIATPSNSIKADSTELPVTILDNDSKMLHACSPDRIITTACINLSQF